MTYYQHLLITLLLYLLTLRYYERRGWRGRRPPTWDDRTVCMGDLDSYVFRKQHGIKKRTSSVDGQGKGRKGK